MFPRRGWRRFAGCCALVMALPGLARAFGFEDVAARAQAEARAAYRAPAVELPAELARLGYDQYRDIRFRPDKALWRREGLPFELMFFHVGGQHAVPVVIHEVVGGEPKRLRFDSADFHYGKNRLAPNTWPDLGYAGFRIHHALNTPAYKDELAVFLGASYFRVLGAGQRYGLSARGLANLQLGKLAEAKADLQEVLKNAPKSAGAMVNLAKTFSAEKNYAEALKFYENALAVDNKNFDALSGALSVLNRQKQFAAAHAKVDEFLGKNADRKDVSAASYRTHSYCRTARGTP